MWRLRPIVGALCAAGLLSGCGAGAAPTAGPTPSALTSRAPSTPVVTSTSTPTSASPSIAANSDAAILAAARGYVTALQRTGATASAAPLLNVTTDSCGCRAGVDRTVGYLQQHGWHLDVRYEIRSASILGRATNAARVRVEISAAPYNALRVDGTVAQSHPGTSNVELVNLEMRGERWLINDVSIA